MPRTASAALLAHMASPSRTIAYLLEVGPLPDGSYVRTNSTARDIRYDGDWFYARTGLQLANIAGTNDLETDNTEAQTLTELPTYPGQGVTTAMVDNGDLDGVEYLIYAINYTDHTMGHCIVHGGPIGRVSYTLDGNLVTMELRAWGDLLRQNSVCSLTSATCRAKQFGSQPGEEREYCGYDLTGEWITDVPVTAVGAEIVRDFTASSLAQATDYFTPGVALWKSGLNEGAYSGIESFASGGVMSLQFVVRHPIQVGDLFDIRRDCTRLLEGNNGCKFYGMILNNRSEAYTPVADHIALTVPGAAAGGLG